MEIADLKKRITDNQLNDIFIVFKYTDNKFLPKQYIDKISEVTGKTIEYIDDISPLMQKSMFSVPSTNLKVHYCEELKDIPVETSNLIIVTKKCPSDDHVVVVPKLEVWQIKDYLYSRCEGAEEKQLNYLFKACEQNIYKIQSESDKIKIFDSVSRKYIIDELFSNGQLPRDNVETIFDFTTALLNRDLNKMAVIYENIDNLDIEPLGVVTILYKNLKNMILVGFQQNPTEANTGIPSKQIWGIQQSLKNQTADRILKMFHIVDDIDYKLKNGELPAEHILNYTVFKCLAV